MVYATRELSVHSGEPVELYRFSLSGINTFICSGQVQESYLGNIYTPGLIKRRPVGLNTDATAPDLEVSLPIDHSLVVQYRIFVPSEPMSLTIYRRHVGDGDVDTVTVWVGRVRSVKWGATQATLICEPLQSWLKRTGLRVMYQSMCNHMLYDNGCKVSKAGFVTPITISTVSGVTITSTAGGFSSQADGFWVNGYITHNASDRRMIISHTADTVTILNPFEDLVASDAVTVVAGCDRTRTDCINKFANLENYLGFPFVPSKNPFDSGIT